MENQPNYKKIFEDIIRKKCLHPEKYSLMLNKKNFSHLDVIKLNDLIFHKSNKDLSVRKFRAYNKLTIMEILEYQKKNNINNTELSRYFKLSRNTIAKWKKCFG